MSTRSQCAYCDRRPRGPLHWRRSAVTSRADGNRRVPNSLVRELREVEPVSLPDRDVRAAQPLLLQGVLRFDTLRAVSRVAILAALDIVSLFLAIWTALAIKAAIKDPEVLGQTFHQAKEYAPLGCLVMVLLF